MVAAVAATMASVSMADVSIKGDAFFSFANRDTGVADSENGNRDRSRMRLFVSGKSGATTVTGIIRNNGDTGIENSDFDGKKSLHMDQLFLTTKLGDVNVKAGDFRGTVGLGAWSFAGAKKNALSVSTKVGGVKVGMFTADGSDTNGTSGSNSTNVSVAGKVSGATVKAVHNPNSDWTNLSVSGKFSGIAVGAEHHKDSTSGATQKVTLLHVGGKAGNFGWDVARYTNKDAAAGSNAIWAPLGSMLVGASARGGTDTAAANAGDFSKILGVAVNTKVAGNTVKAIYTKSTIGAADKVTGAELILTRNVSGGKLTANLAKLSDHDTAATNGTNKGIRFDVKF